MSEHSKKKITKKQIFAWVGIGILVSLYIVCLVLAFIHTEWAQNMLYVAIAATAGVPTVIYLMMMFYKLSHRDDPKPEEDLSDEDNPKADAGASAGQEQTYRATGIRAAANAVAHISEEACEQSEKQD